MIRRNLRYSIIEGSFFAFMFGLGENYLSALGVFLGYSALQISIMSSLPELSAAFMQLKSSTFSKLFQSMKNFCVFVSILQAIMWLILVFLINCTDKYMVFLVWSIIYFMLAAVIGPVWTSWIGYLVPVRIRSNYHANRNKIINSVIFISIILGALILKFLENKMILAFSIMFFIAFIGRILSAYYLNKKQNAGDVLQNDTYDFKNILKSSVKRKFIIFNTSITFSVMFLGPLFTIYILRTMDLSYFVLTCCMAAWWSGNILSSKSWGNLAKKHGNISILKISTIMMCVLPFFWIGVYYFDHSGRILVSILINLLAGITFSGFGLSAFNFVYEISDKNEVVKFTSLINCFRGIAIFIGSVTAGAIVDSRLIIDFFEKYYFTSIQFSMVLSIILRCISYFSLTKLEKVIDDEQ